MRTEYQIIKELESIQIELNQVAAMSEQSVCAKYNADSKQEIIDILNEEIQALEKELSSLPCEIVGEVYGYDYY